MAAGDWATFEETSKYVGLEAFDFDGDVFKVGIVTVAPTAADAAPSWATYQANAHNTGSLGPTFDTATTWTEVGGVATFKATSFTISKDVTADGSTECWAVLYDHSNASTRGVGFIHLSNIDLTLSDVVIKFSGEANGSLGNVLTITVSS